MVAVGGCSDVTATVGVFLERDDGRARAAGKVMSFEDLLSKGRGRNHERWYAA